MKPAAVIGGGSWGTALAIHLAGLGRPVALWVYEADLAGRMAEQRENDVFLPGFPLPPNLEVTNELDRALDRAEFVLTVMPSHVCRPMAERMAPLVTPGQILVSATKGLEEGTHLRMTSILEEVLGPCTGPGTVAVISGPSFARETAAGQPTAVVAAATDPGTAERVQQALSGNLFRLYSTTDVIGVELGGAVKNVIAIAAGVVEGIGLGHNTTAALITRGLVEMERLSLALGAKPGTLAGLSGMGDLVLTCTGQLSRNRSLGVELGKGKSLDQAMAGKVTVAEGVRTTRSVLELAGKHGVEMPITSEMNAVLHQGADPAEAIGRLMERRLKPEKE
jgi:glycerol-3-phosphate dehydrogenase (NAD(P)+)